MTQKKPADAHLADTLSPVDLPAPPAPLPHGLRWTNVAIATATLVLALTNAHALRGWSYQLPPNAASARVVAIVETWYDTLDPIGLNRPVEAMHDAWQAFKGLGFGAQPPAAASDSRNAAQ
jgi:hypothetical protein